MKRAKDESRRTGLRSNSSRAIICMPKLLDALCIRVENALEKFAEVDREQGTSNLYSS